MANVEFIGLGILGKPMALNLIKGAAKAGAGRDHSAMVKALETLEALTSHPVAQ